MKYYINLKQGVFLLFLLFVSGYSQAEVLSSFNYNTAGGQSGPAFTYLDFELALIDIDSPIYSEGYILFDDFVFGAGDVGTTFIANEITDSGFINVAQQLTNGIDNYMKLQSYFSQDLSGGGSGAGSIKAESEWLFGETGLGDLSGFIIESIEVTVNDAAFYENFTNPYSGDIVNYWAEADLTITVNGNAIFVPEASSIYLLVFGLLVLFGSARRKV